MSEDLLWESRGAIFRPSYSATWLNCAGSLHPSLSAIDTAGWDAAVGTVFHRVMAEWLECKERPDHWLGRKELVEKPYGEVDDPGFIITVDEEMLAYGQDCVDYLDRIPGDKFYEISVDISDLTPIHGQTGTADVVACQPGILDIIDWKYGRGVQVFAEKNTQLLLYAWGAFQKYDFIYGFQIIRLHIAQPRLNHWDVWEITAEELMAFGEYARKRAYAAWFERDRSPSPKACQWCRIRTTCNALELAREALADQSFDVLDEPMTPEQMNTVPARLARQEEEAPQEPRALTSPAKLSTNDLIRIYEWRKLMEAWFADIHEELLRRADDGHDLMDRFKVVIGRTRRRWGDEHTAEEHLGNLLGDDLFETKLRSPAQIEKLLKNEGVPLKLAQRFVNLYTVRPQGKPTLVPTGDARLAIPNVVDDSFEPLDDEL